MLPLKTGNNGTTGTNKRATFSTRQKKLKRTVTRFIDQSNIEESEQIDLAEFILAAQYLTNETDTDKLMSTFNELEQTGELKQKDNETTKDMVKRIVSNVGYDEENMLEETVNEYVIDDEVMMPKPLNSINEDSAWQDNKLDGFLANTYDEQNVSIARNLLHTTALSPEQISDITGVHVDTIDKMIEEDDEFDENEEESSDYETDEEFEKDDKDKDENKQQEKPSVTIKSEKLSKEVHLTLEETKKLDTLVTDGIEALKMNGDDVIMLLKKLKKCVGLSPQGMKKMKTVRHLKVFGKEFDKKDEKKDTKKEDKNTETKKDNKNDKMDEKEQARQRMLEKSVKIIQKSRKKKIPKNDIVEFLKNRDMSQEDIDEAFHMAFFMDNAFPCKYRVVIHPGALVKEKHDIKSNQVGKIPIGAVVIVEEIKGRRARLSSPKVGWCSVTSSDKRSILQKEGTKSKEMIKALQADRANETKIQILQSVTTLNEKVVRRILEKSDWNLRRAIDAFYIAKFQTQKFIKQKEENSNKKDTNKKETKKDDKKDTKKTNNTLGPNTKKNNSNTNDKEDPNTKKKGFWKSWTKFAKNG